MVGPWAGLVAGPPLAGGPTSSPWGLAHRPMRHLPAGQVGRHCRAEVEAQGVEAHRSQRRQDLDSIRSL